jgi:hypothetical protein
MAVRSAAWPVWWLAVMLGVFCSNRIVGIRGRQGHCGVDRNAKAELRAAVEVPRYVLNARAALLLQTRRGVADH